MSSNPSGYTDHVSFNDVGVPGFNPIQDYVNYDVRTHHTNMDTVERVEVKDIRQAALVMAWFAYQRRDGGAEDSARQVTRGSLGRVYLIAKTLVGPNMLGGTSPT